MLLSPPVDRGNATVEDHEACISGKMATALIQHLGRHALVKKSCGTFFLVFSSLSLIS